MLEINVFAILMFKCIPKATQCIKDKGIKDNLKARIKIIHGNLYNNRSKVYQG